MEKANVQASVKKVNIETSKIMKIKAHRKGEFKFVLCKSLGPSNVGFEF